MHRRLQALFGKGKSIRVEEGQNEQTKVVLRHQGGATAEVYLQGAHVTSWHVPSFGEMLFVSNNALFEPGKAIRGGIPIIFPQFGPGPLTSHGFARSALWELHHSDVLANGTVTVTLKLESWQKSLDIWPRNFRIDLGIHLSDTLGLTFRVMNSDRQEMTFQHAFHTYFQIRSIHKAVVSGLHQMSYIDKLAGNEQKIEKSRILTFSGEMDRIYTSVPRPVLVLDPVYKRKIVIAKRNLADYVVWNPWEEKSRTMEDMTEGAYQNMLCVEAGNIERSITLQPGAQFEGYMNLSVLSINAPDPDAEREFISIPPL